MNCEDLVELVTEYLEGTLPAAERVAFDAHLAECDGCARYLEQIRLTVSLVGEADRLRAQPEMTALLHAFRNWREAHPRTR